MGLFTRSIEEKLLDMFQRELESNNIPYAGPVQLHNNPPVRFGPVTHLVRAVPITCFFNQSKLSDIRIDFGYNEDGVKGIEISASFKNDYPLGCISKALDLGTGFSLGSLMQEIENVGLKLEFNYCHEDESRLYPYVIRILSYQFPNLSGKVIFDDFKKFLQNLHYIEEKMKEIMPKILMLGLI